MSDPTAKQTTADDAAKRAVNDGRLEETVARWIMAYADEHNSGEPNMMCCPSSVYAMDGPFMPAWQHELPRARELIALIRRTPYAP